MFDGWLTFLAQKRDLNYIHDENCAVQAGLGLACFNNFEYAHLMEKARIMVVQYGINDTGQWDHMGEG